jgi:hypothetical protein
LWGIDRQAATNDDESLLKNKGRSKLGISNCYEISS